MTARKYLNVKIFCQHISTEWLELNTGEALSQARQQFPCPLSVGIFNLWPRQSGAKNKMSHLELFVTSGHQPSQHYSS